MKNLPFCFENALFWFKTGQVACLMLARLIRSFETPKVYPNSLQVKKICLQILNQTGKTMKKLIWNPNATLNTRVHAINWYISGDLKADLLAHGLWSNELLAVDRSKTYSKIVSNIDFKLWTLQSLLTTFSYYWQKNTSNTRTNE